MSEPRIVVAHVERGCPCEHTCCDDPDVFTPDCECDPDDACCEHAWHAECRSCGDHCACQV